MNTPDKLSTTLTNTPDTHEVETGPLVFRKRSLTIALVCGIAVLVAIGVVPRLSTRQKLRDEATSQATSPTNVFVTRATATPAGVVLELSGTLSPITEAPVLSRTDGYLARRVVDIGDRVRKGQLLAVISAPELDQQVTEAQALVKQSEDALEQSKSALDEARANAGIAKITADRWAALQARGAVSKQANDSYQFAYDAQTAATNAAAANVASTMNSVSANVANLRHYRELQEFEQIRAPYDGVITQRNVDDGALITATSTLLFRIARTERLRTFIDVPQLNATAIKVGDDAAVAVSQYPDQVFHGQITRIADALNLNTRTLLTEVDLDNGSGRLLPGMYATVRFNLPRAVNAILIPGEALMFRAEGTIVAVVAANQRIELRHVIVGHDYGDSLEIRSGLNPGDAVVINPTDQTLEGARANPVFIQRASESLGPAVLSTANH